MTDRCACCGRPLSPVARFDDVCEICTRGLWQDARLLRGADDVRGVVEWLTLHGCLTLSRYVIGVLPFDDA